MVSVELILCSDLSAGMCFASFDLMVNTAGTVKDCDFGEGAVELVGYCKSLTTGRATASDSGNRSDRESIRTYVIVYFLDDLSSLGGTLRGKIPHGDHVMSCCPRVLVDSPCSRPSLSVSKPKCNNSDDGVYFSPLTNLRGSRGCARYWTKNTRVDVRAKRSQSKSQQQLPHVHLK